MGFEVTESKSGPNNKTLKMVEPKHHIIVLKKSWDGHKRVLNGGFQLKKNICVQLKSSYF